MTATQQVELMLLNENEVEAAMEKHYNNLQNAETTRERRNEYDCMVYLYNTYECLKNLWEHIADNFKIVTRFVKKVIKTVAKKVRHSKYDDIITNYTDYDINAKNGELCYLFEFYNDDDILLCSKVGTTTRTIKKRLSEELRSKTYKEMGATKATINRVYQCGDLPAEGLESLIRSEYIKKYPKSFKKNDRFINEYFDFNKCDEIAKNYLEMA